MTKKWNTKRIAAVVLIAATLSTVGCGKGTGSAQPLKSESVMEPVSLEDLKPSEDETVWEAYTRYMEENQLSESVMTDLDRFAYHTGSALLKNRKTNLNYSPLSLYYGLSMAAAGAEGETFEQMAGILGIEASKDLSVVCGNLYKSIFYSSHLIEARNGQNNTKGNMAGLSIANSLWLNRDIPIKDSYTECLNHEFYASVYRVSFNEDHTWKEIGHWIKENTNGVLEPELSKDEDTVLALINSLYYYGTWTNKFPTENTQRNTFTRADDSSTEVDFMEITAGGQRFYEGEDYLAASMNTRTGASVVFAIPKEGYRVDELFSTPEKLKSVLNSSYVDAEIHWRVPKFSFGSSMDMKEILQKLGIESMFGDEADFKGMTDHKVKVSKIIQESHIGMDESGVEGAAYTMVTLGEGAALLPKEIKAEMILNRPFLYGIHDKDAGWIFLGVVDEPVNE